MLQFLAQTTQPVTLDADSVQKLIQSGQNFIISLTALITSAAAILGLVAKIVQDVRSKAHLRNDVTSAQTVAGTALQRSAENAQAIRDVSLATTPPQVVAAIAAQQAPASSNARPPLTGSADILPKANQL